MTSALLVVAAGVIPGKRSATRDRVKQCPPAAGFINWIPAFAGMTE
jgi:hypothetical protein